MQRHLPAQPHLDHLKKQAKALLDGHKQRDPEALLRFGEALPSCAGRSPAEIASTPLALHDAQSALAREYGFPSWSELRAEVAKRSEGTLTEGTLTESMMRALVPVPLPDAVNAALREAWSRRDATATVLTTSLPATLPVLAARNTLVIPRSLAPLHLGRPASLAAVDAALALTPPLLAIFAQRSEGTEAVTAESLHPIGCLALVSKRVPEGERAFVILEGLRWISLVALESASGEAGYLVARVAEVHVDAEAEAAAVPALTQSLRERARRLASAMPAGDRVVAILDAITEPAELADLVIANLPCSVDDKARYASATTLVERLRIAGALAGSRLGPSL